ncbi:MAG: TIGR03960 family B12-binding radical SAM protein [Anaerolineae bacterium]|nr:TIGR03960 family B12-binding radical SAM protein [Anaerolineae bacterium]
MSAVLSREVLDRMLAGVEKPARYTGAEWNSVVKPWEGARVRMVLAFPDVYEIGMSNLGLMVLYDLVNAREDMLAERTYAPWPDMAAAMRAQGVPLYSLESRRPLTDFDVVGFSLGYELNFTTVLEMLDLAGLPLLASERDDTMPLVIAGGSACYNPEPMADFFDLVVIGDGEEALLELGELYRDFGRSPVAEPGSRAHRARFLRAAATLAGVYVPELYRPRYDETGCYQGLEAVAPEAPDRVTARVVRPLPPPPTRPVVPYLETVHDRAMVEVRRGCGRGCRFCQAGIIYRPVRERPVAEVEEAAARIIASTGYDELGLLSLSTCDYRPIEQLLERLIARFGEEVAISLPSLRLDSFSVKLADMVQRRRRTGLTFAPEAGTQRLRDVINKNVTEDNLREAAEAAFSHGWQRIKLYFMVGLPTETDEDVEGIARLAREVLAIGRRHHGRRARVSVSVSTFIPKPHTPFQWAPLVSDDDLERRQGILRRGMRGQGLELAWHDVRATYVEALLARGDRRLGPVIRRAWELGARFDPWEEHFRPEAWRRALKETGVDGDRFARNGYDMGQALPWDHVDTGVRRSFLERECRRALGAERTPDCFEACSACGVSGRYGVACWE